MSKVGLIRGGTHPSTSSLQAASPLPHVPGEREVAAEVAPAVGSLEEGVTHFRATYTEELPGKVLEKTHQVTALLTEHVPIPWLHGEQRVVR